MCMTNTQDSPLVSGSLHVCCTKNIRNATGLMTPRLIHLFRWIDRFWLEDFQGSPSPLFPYSVTYVFCNKKHWFAIAVILLLKVAKLFLTCLCMASHRDGGRRFYKKGGRETTASRMARYYHFISVHRAGLLVYTQHV